MIKNNMWKDSTKKVDPDGVSSTSSNILESPLNEPEHSMKLSQLKEVIRNTDQSNLTQEKVNEYMNTLMKMNIKVKQKNKGDTGRSIDVPPNEKINLLRQQLEENKAKLAERDKNQKGIEEMVIQLKAQLDDSQQLLFNQPNLNLSSLSNQDYGPDSSADDLYNILINKEKRITELTSKVQKFETQILDLQENIKEKDSVIEARTKAITLMTENLTKKSKTTIDNLEETQQQMRKMQENFANLEAEMKARQLTLLNDLKNKNYEINDLQETIEQLKSYNNELKENNQKFVNTEVNNYKIEIEKLKKQYDESNKNIIKIKAQHKAKVKELNDKINQFKKVNDVNAELMKISNENLKLTEKIVELEEEKENLQLKLIEFESNKIIEKPYQTDDCEQLTKVSNVINSIQLEEQLENLEKEKNEILLENSTIKQQYNELNNKFENLIKEKQELSTKLDHYIQENIDLVDKLEKLSVEKVSSAESIEIVENFTQQEKLELEAYQKNVQLKEIDDNTQQNNDLHDSVNELNEEIAELLQKIELFSIERREVMEKMEHLTQENNKLTLKIKEIDVLVETYEELKNEKDTIMNENKELKNKINNSLVNNDNVIKQLEEELKNYKEMFEDIKDKLTESEGIIRDLQNHLEEKNMKIQKYEEENSILTNSINELNKIISNIENEKTDLQNKHIHLQEINEEISKEKDEEINELIEERNNLQQLIKEKDEMFHKMTNELKEKYLTLQKQIDNNTTNLEDIKNPLNSKIEELTNKNKEQLEKMKKLAANLKKKNQSYNELDYEFKNYQKKLDVEILEKNKKIEDLMSEIQELEQKLLKLQNYLDEKTQNIQELTKNLDEYQENKIILENKNLQIQNSLDELYTKLEKNEINLQQELLLNQDNITQTVTNNENKLQAKILELEMIKENQETELNNYKQRINKLEERILYAEERRSSLEKKSIELGVQLEEKNSSFEEICQTEDLLEKRLAALTEHDIILEKKLNESIEENQELKESNIKMNTINEKIKKKLVILQEKIKELSLNEDKIICLEKQNEEMKKHVEALDHELKKLQQKYNYLLEDHRMIDHLHNELQIQYDEIIVEKTNLQSECDKLSEEKNEYKLQIEMKDNEIQKLINENQLNNKKLFENEKELENYKIDTQTNLKQMIEENDSLKNDLQANKNKLQEIENEFQQLLSRNTKNEENKGVASFFTNTISLIEEPPNDQLPIINRKLEEYTKENEILKKKIKNLETNLDIDKHTNIQEKLQEIMKIIKSLQYSFDNQMTTSDPASFFDIPSSKTINNQLIQDLKYLENQFNDISQDLIQVKSTNLSSDQSTKGYQQIIIHKEDNLEELMNKIKTLEFMLFNAEKEKEDVLMQCNKLSEGLTTLLYERENKIDTLDSQILTKFYENEENKNELEKIEFELTEPPVTLIDKPVEEKLFQKEISYKCYMDDEEIPFKNEGSSNQLTSYFGSDNNDDGWGFGPEEAKLEEEHINQSGTIPLVERIRILEIEKENYLEEIKQLQIKSSKLIKKLKEIKQKNEELLKKKSDLFDLDDTIQEEFKLQIQQIERKLLETKNELDKEKEENLQLMKKIDVLTSSNNRLVDLKEKQDCELMNLQRSYQELNKKLNKFEWGCDDGFINKPIINVENNEDLLKKIEELDGTIRDLSADNEELQALLEDQKNYRKLYENQQEEITVLNKKNQSLEVLLNDQKTAYDESIKINDLNKQLNDLKEHEDLIQNELDKLKEKYEELEESLKIKLEEIIDLQNKLTISNEGNKHLENEINNLIQFQNDNSIIIKNLEKDKSVLLNDFQKFQIEKEDNQQLLISLNKEKDDILNKLEKLEEENKIFKDQNNQINNLLNEKEVLLKDFQNKNNDKDNEIKKFDNKIMELIQEWQTKVDQRGSDVAESWKLHLEVRESEFSQMETYLRKEINELEEKCAKLANEKNELLKNVDVEIKNEVNQMSILQQQIIDSQSIINELKINLTDKQKEMEQLNQLKVKEDQEILSILQNHYNITQSDGILHYLRKLSNDLTTYKTDLQETQVEKDELQNTTHLLQNSIASLQNQLHELQNLKDYESENSQNLHQHLVDYQETFLNLNRQLQEKQTQIEENLRMLDLNNTEINRMKDLLKEKDESIKYLEDEHLKSVTTLKKTLIETNEILNSKIQENEELSIEINKCLANINDLQQIITMKNTEIVQLQEKIQEEELLIEEDRKQMIELKEIIEEQVLKIEEYKNELFNKSNEYDSVIAQFDLSQGTTVQNTSLPDADLSELVSRAELDLAHYMLHQRDVRCEELTVELTQLLEERDILQLKLSNAIREKEDLIKKFSQNQSTTNKLDELENIEEIEKIQEPANQLATKLSELKTIGYKKDKTIVDEQEFRRLQELSIMQQHRDEASKLPPEAAARLVDASYTLSRDVQSPSKVLLNWLWGKSTPKINEI